MDNTVPRGADTLDAVDDFVARFLAFPSDAARTAVTLWAAHAHLVDASDNSPRLALLSPEPGSGKTRVLEVLELLTPAPMFSFAASTAATFRTLAKEQRTLLFDEVDAIFGRRGADDTAEDLRALLNVGHRRGASIPRCVGPTHDVRDFPVFAAVALAGLGDLPDTLMSRSVVVRMRRRAPGEDVEQFRRRLHAPDGELLREQLAAWCAAVRDDVAAAWPLMPDGVQDRDADVWEPLLAVADAAGGPWPDAARAACAELVKVTSNREASLGVKLLDDLRGVFADADALSTDTILAALHALEESPWADLRGKPLDARGLARRLRQYDITSRVIRVGDSTPRGYRREDLHDAWTRYLSPTPEKAQQAQHGQLPRSQGVSAVAATDAVAQHRNTSATDDKPLTSNDAHVADVADSRGSQPPCTVCGLPLPAAATGDGFTTHPTCD